MGKFNSSSLNIKSSANWDFSIARLVYSGAPLTSGSHKSHRSESIRVSGLDHHHFSQAIPPFHHVRIRKNSSNNSSLGYPQNQSKSSISFGFSIQKFNQKPNHHQLQVFSAPGGALGLTTRHRNSPAAVRSTLSAQSKAWGARR